MMMGSLSSHLAGMKIKHRREFEDKLIVVTGHRLRLNQPRIFTEGNKTYFNLWWEGQRVSDLDLSLMTKDDMYDIMEKLEEENDRLKQHDLHEDEDDGDGEMDGTPEERRVVRAELMTKLESAGLL